MGESESSCEHQLRSEPSGRSGKRSCDIDVTLECVQNLIRKPDIVNTVSGRQSRPPYGSFLTEEGDDKELMLRQTMRIPQVSASHSHQAASRNFCIAHDVFDHDHHVL